MQREYYSASIKDFLAMDAEIILGKLMIHDEFSTSDLQKNSWRKEITILQEQLRTFEDGEIAFEYTIPRIGHRIDVVCIICGVIFLLEFKVGECEYKKATDDQVMDYALDLKYFHEKSAGRYIVPISVPTEAPRANNTLHMMVGESGKSHTGAMHYYYKCGNAKRKKGCDKKAVKKDWIERAVIRLTMERVLNEEKINKIIDALLTMQERENVTIPALRRQLAEVEKGIENMLNAIQQGIFTASTKQRLEELEKHKEELSLSITTAELQKPKLTREYMEHWFSQFRYGDPNDREFQKRLIDTFVNAVFVYDDKLVLTYNYQHGTQTITLKEVEDFLGSDLVGLSPPSQESEAKTSFLRK